MTPAERATLRHFYADERYQNGQPVDYAVLKYRTLYWVDELREFLDAPIWLIRGPHPGRPDDWGMVDATCPEIPLSQVFMGLDRVPEISFGVYAGNSFHVDTRPFDHFPKRWMAVKEEHAVQLQARGLQGLTTGVQDGWIYLNWSHPNSFDALSLVFELAEQQRLKGA